MSYAVWLSHSLFLLNLIVQHLLENFGQLYPDFVNSCIFLSEKRHEKGTDLHVELSGLRLGSEIWKTSVRSDQAHSVND